MAEHNEFYRRARYYDAVFDRDVSGEVDFLERVHERLRGRLPRSVLDLACGPGYHALEFAARGTRAAGLDLRPEMLELGREKGAARGVPVEWVEADMRRFVLEPPVDLAFCLFDGIDALLTDDDLTLHLKAVAAALTPGGLYLVDLTHPRDCGYQDYGDFHYEGGGEDLHVRIDWAINDPLPDPVSGVCDTRIRLTVRDEGSTRVIEDSARERFLVPRELALLAERSGALEPAAWYGDYDADRPLDSGPASRRMICALRRPAGT